MASTSQSDARADERRQKVEEILKSDIGVAALLARLKQSITSTRDFAAFLKKRAALEDDHAQGLRKLCRATHESLRRPDSRQGSYLAHFEEMTRVHEKLADNGQNFAMALNVMHDELTEMAANMERGRKQWKQFGMSSEKKVHDAEAMVEKAKAKYDSTAEEYERVRTGDRRPGKFSGLRGGKGGSEEELQRRVQAADMEYNSKVQAANAHRQELMQTQRPQTITALKEMIEECDSGLALQLQKYASSTEKLFLQNGTAVSPYDTSNGSRRMRDVVGAIDNQDDFHVFVLDFAAKMPAGAQHTEIRYQPHPAVSTPSQQPLPQQPPPPPQKEPQQQQQQQQQQHQHQHTLSNQYPPQHQGNHQQYNNQQHHQGPPPPPPQHHQAAPPQQHHPLPQPNFSSANSHTRSDSIATPHTPTGGYQPFPPVSTYQSPAPAPQGPSAQSPQVPPSNFGNSPPPPTSALASPPPHHPQPHQRQPSVQSTTTTTNFPDLPPLRPVFGVPLEQLLERDNSAVPILVYQCIQAVDLFGLTVEGIYRIPATKPHVDALIARFNHDASRIDFTDPAQFFHDVNSVASVLKHYLRSLPEPLFTNALHHELIKVAQIDDDVARRDSLHALINTLPDANYATLRLLAMHLHRVQENRGVNRMTTANLGIVFGPTLMWGGEELGDGAGEMREAGWAVRVVETMVAGCYSIFE